MKNHLLWAALIAAVVRTVVVMGLIGLTIVALLKYLTS